ncbi:putative secretory lipase [Thozetella sp. PMI_491]|nr:putative secretory lipase [Thozetella sp. PMI_491]
MKSTALALLSVGAVVIHGQMLPTPQEATTDWNSTFKFSPEQIEVGSLPPALAGSLEVILNFDRTQLANGGPTYDSFYKISNSTKPCGPGQVLKVERFTDPTPYNIPAWIAMSRIIYSSENLNGTLVPASAYILWPWTPKTFSPSSPFQPEDKAPVVLWTHGTSGFYADGAPSAHRSLFYGEIMPTVLAQAGYVVIAPDYAGLGVDKSWDGSFLPHQYFGREAGAADALNALRAARKTFSDLITEEYVVVGHSQGGAVAWGTAEVLAQYPEKYQDVENGYLGNIVFAPGINVINAAPNIFLPWIGKYLDKVFPGFKLEDWLSPLGVARTSLLTAVQGGQFFSQVLFNNFSAVVNPQWNESWYASTFNKLSNPGNRPWKGPILLIQGTEDIAANYNTSLNTFRSTCEKYPGNFEFVTVPKTGHFPCMEATRQRWLDWIEARFEKTAIKQDGCVENVAESFLPIEQYSTKRQYFSQWSGAPQWFYQLPQGG